jgi:signal transduction histidine kinase
MPLFLRAVLLRFQELMKDWHPLVDEDIYAEYIAIQVLHNMRRVRVFTYVLLFIHIPLIVLDIIALQTSNATAEAYRWRFALMQTHIGIVVAMIGFLPIVWLRMPHHKSDITRWHNRSGYLFGLVCIVWSASVSTVDQLLVGSITVYIMGCLGVASFLLLGFRASVVVFASGLCVMLSGIAVLQSSATLQFSNTINALAFTIIAWSFSRILYAARLREVASTAMIEQQKNHLLHVNEELALTNRQMAVQQQHVERQNAELLRLNEEKSEVLGIVAHDLRNPLTIIQTTAELILYKLDDSKNVIELVEQILEASSRMNRMVEYLLERDELEQRIAGVELCPITISPLVESVISMFQERADSKGILLQYDNLLAPEKDICYANEVMTYQVMENLISNAVKYSPQGKRVAVRVQSSEGVVRVEVQDEGPGLSDEDKKKLFGKFARLSAQPTGGEHSTGLGLSIVKKLVEAMHGRVWCESELGKGATFIVELPSISINCS